LEICGVHFLGMARADNTRFGAAKGWLDESSLPALAPEPPRRADDVAMAGHGPARERWPAKRIAAVEALWGAGFTGPGGPPETLRLAKPLGLHADIRLLLVGGGLGGPAEAIAENYGSAVMGYESDPELLRMSAARHARHSQALQFVDAAWDPAAPEFKPRSANHALSLEALRGARLPGFIRGMAAALLPKGGIVVTELVTEQDPPDNDREFSAWCRLEHRQPNLPREAEVTQALSRLCFDVRLVEDLSDRHVNATLAGWRAAVKIMEEGPKPDPASAGAFVTEAELWLLRIRLMRRLGLRLLRWHAVGMA
jgi:hypothetical protein